MSVYEDDADRLGEVEEHFGVCDECGAEDELDDGVCEACWDGVTVEEGEDTGQLDDWDDACADAAFEIEEVGDDLEEDEDGWADVSF